MLMTFSAPQELRALDVSRKYLRTLQPAEAVITAQLQAHLAGQAMHNNWERKSCQAVTLSDANYNSVDGPKPSLTCRQVIFSSCGHLAAVTYEGDHEAEHSLLWPSSQKSAHELPEAGLVVFQASNSFQELSRVQGALRAPVIAWVPDLPHLCIAYLGPNKSKSSDGLRPPAVFVVNARTGVILHTLRTRPEQVMQGMLTRYMNELVWGTCASKLLVVSHTGTAGENMEGWISIFDLRQGKRTVRTRFSMRLIDELTTVAVWHPTLAGLVLCGGVHLRQPDVFAKAELAMGYLPQDCLVVSSDGTGFSSDGSQLVAQLVQHGNGEGSALNYSVLRCQLLGNRFRFKKDLQLQGYGCHWVPNSKKLIVGLDTVGARDLILSYLVDASPHLAQFRVQIPFSCNAKPLELPFSFSPCQGLLGESSFGGRIFCLTYGAQGSAADDSDSAQMHVEAIHAFLPSGRGWVSSGRSSAHTSTQDVLHVVTFA